MPRKKVIVGDKELIHKSEEFVDALKQHNISIGRVQVVCTICGAKLESRYGLLSKAIYEHETSDVHEKFRPVVNMCKKLTAHGYVPILPEEISHITLFPLTRRNQQTFVVAPTKTTVSRKSITIANATWFKSPYQSIETAVLLTHVYVRPIEISKHGTIVTNDASRGNIEMLIDFLRLDERDAIVKIGIDKIRKV